MNRLFMILTLGSAILPGSTLTLNFEQFTDGEQLTNQIAGVSFSNAVVLEAGLSLNEFEFPPRSGTRVIVDDGGPITVEFAAAIDSFTGFFTYLQRLSLVAVDSNGNPLASVESLYGANTALSGEPNSTPLEQLTLTYAPGFRRVILTGDSLGQSFVADDIEVRYRASTDPAPIPEPGSVALVAGSLIGIAWWRRKRAAWKFSRLAGSFVALGAALWAQQPAPVVSNPYIAQNEITNVRISVDLSSVGSSLIPGSVQALRVQGSTFSLLGSLVDDGTNGDLVANDGVFSRNFALNPGSAPSLTVTANYATRGSIRRTMVGQASIVTFVPVGAPVEQPIGAAGATLAVGEDAVVEVPTGTFSGPTYVSVRVMDQRVFEEGAVKPPDNATVLAGVKPIRIEAGLRPSKALPVRLKSPAVIELGANEELFVEVVTPNDGESEFMSIHRERAFRCGARQSVCVDLKPSAFFRVNPYLAYLRVVKAQVNQALIENAIIMPNNNTPATVQSGFKFSFQGELANPFSVPPLAQTIVTSSFAPRCEDAKGKKRTAPHPCPPGETEAQHKGIDLRAQTQLPIFAAAAGIPNPGCGKGGHFVELNFDGGISSVSRHIKPSSAEPYVPSGRDKRVVAGAQVAVTGNSGDCSTPPKEIQAHLHYEVWISGLAADPLPFVQNAMAEFGPDLKLIARLETNIDHRVLPEQSFTLFSNVSRPVIQMEYTLTAADMSGLDCGVNGCRLSFYLKSPPVLAGGLNRLDIKLVEWVLRAGRELTVSKTGTGSGTVTSNPVGITCGTTCSADFDLNSEVVLIANPSVGSVFSGWSEACSGTGAQSLVKMDANKQCVATFNTTQPAGLFFDTSPSGNFTVQFYDSTNALRFSTFVPAARGNFNVPLNSLAPGVYNMIIILSGGETRGSFALRLSGGVTFEPPGDTSRNQTLSNGTIGFPRQVVWPIRIL